METQTYCSQGLIAGKNFSPWEEEGCARLRTGRLGTKHRIPPPLVLVSSRWGPAPCSRTQSRAPACLQSAAVVTGHMQTLLRVPNSTHPQRIDGETDVQRRGRKASAQRHSSSKCGTEARRQVRLPWHFTRHQAQSGSGDHGETTPSTLDLLSALTGPSCTHFSDWRTPGSLSLTTVT